MSDNLIVANIRALAIISVLMNSWFKGVDCDAAARYPGRGKILQGNYRR